ncbi:MAG TPA: hypothetical protein VJ793_08955, partial [Anaerolineae bacterium]|nr:hypothetical protein [Anaerolineae bacterium]
STKVSRAFPRLFTGRRLPSLQCDGKTGICLYEMPGKRVEQKNWVKIRALAGHIWRSKPAKASIPIPDMALAKLQYR